MHTYEKQEARIMAQIAKLQHKLETLKAQRMINAILRRK